MANSSPSPIRVAAVGTGNVGKHALTQLINDDRFDLTAVWVSSEAKAGKDAAELAGLPQQCLRADRLSLLYQWGRPEAEAMDFEFGSMSRVAAESLEGASRFAAGAGRHGAKA